MKAEAGSTVEIRRSAKHWRQLLSLGIAALLLLLATVSGMTQTAAHNRAHHETANDRFVGAWKLAWLERTAADGTRQRIECCGMLVFTRDGHMSVQVMEHDSPATAAAAPEQYSQGGYEASYGTYAVDGKTHTFTFHVEGALVRTLMGKDLARRYEFSGKQLIVRPPRSDEHWTVCWERY